MTTVGGQSQEQVRPHADIKEFWSQLLLHLRRSSLWLKPIVEVIATICLVIFACSTDFAARKVAAAQQSTAEIAKSLGKLVALNTGPNFSVNISPVPKGGDPTKPRQLELKNFGTPVTVESARVYEIVIVTPLPSAPHYWQEHTAEIMLRDYTGTMLVTGTPQNVLARSQFLISQSKIGDLMAAMNDPRTDRPSAIVSEYVLIELSYRTSAPGVVFRYIRFDDKGMRDISSTDWGRIMGQLQQFGTPKPRDITREHFFKYIDDKMKGLYDRSRIKEVFVEN
jgi:hypothetical protein